MKWIRVNSLICYGLMMICAFSNSAVGDPKAAFYIQQPLTETELEERINLYKHIKVAQNKKVLVQLLHDIADIQRQCHDKGYLCTMEGGSAVALPIAEHSAAVQGPDAPAADPSERIAAPELDLLGIVGNRARLRLEDGQVKDFVLGDAVTDWWKVSEIGIESIVLLHKEQPQITARYQIDRDASFVDTQRSVVNVP